MRPIYTPKGRAGEYGEFALNIYTGCNHGCTYCYARRMAERFGRDFDHVEPRPGILDAVKDQIKREKIVDKEIFLCFSCDPYPHTIDTTVTRQIIEVIKNSGNHIRVLTKGGMRAKRDFDLLDGDDWLGVTISTDKPYMYEPFAAGFSLREDSLIIAHEFGIKTWVSCEPVIDPPLIYQVIQYWKFVDMFKIGKMNYQKSEINWAEFGQMAERLCKRFDRNYMIKDDLRKEMNK